MKEGIVDAEQREALASYIKKDLIRNPAYPLKSDEPLITGGLVDSFSLVELALFIEETFGVHFDDVELTADNMNTLDQIARNIEAKQ
jgi:acyl carrier protein